MKAFLKQGLDKLKAEFGDEEQQVSYCLRDKRGSVARKVNTKWIGVFPDS
jgi:hypothetical protein